MDLANTGERAGDEVVMVYVRDLVSQTTTPVKALKATRRLTLQPGEKQTVVFEIGYEQLSLLDVQLKRIVEPGDFQVWVGSQTTKFTLRAD